jgi:hypothetical protein
MSNKNLFKEAIADAKAVREAALANAKAALEEALTPKLHSMLAEKMKEYGKMEEEYSYEDGEMEEGFTSPHDKDHSQTDFFMPEGDELEEEFDISEILAELDEDYSLEEAKKENEMKMKMKMKKKKMNEADDEEESEEESVADMTIDDLKALIADIVAQEMGGEEGDEMEAGEEEMEIDSEEESEEIDLEELLAELDGMGMGKDEGGENLEEIDIMKGLKNVGSSLKAGIKSFAGDNNSPCFKRAETKFPGTPGRFGGLTGVSKSDEWVAEYIKCRRETDPNFSFATFGKTRDQEKEDDYGFGPSEGKKAQQELTEAIRTINTLRRELNEVNLLNAKLLYVNKIFKAKNLSESQKLQVISSFDKATTAKEAKVVFESLNATLTTAAPKQAIKESLGFASRAVGVAPRKAIVESNDVITRMQKLANIIK